MDWLNLHIPTVLRSPEFIGAEPVDRSTHIMLLAYCASQENGGVIAGAAAWKDRKWQQLAAVTRDETRRECDLWHWQENDLHVRFYPADKEQEVRAKREIAKTNGRKSGGRPRIQAGNQHPNQPGNPAQTNVGYFQKPTSVISAKAEGEGEGEGKEKANTPRANSGGVSVPDIVALYPRREDLAAACEAVEKHIKAGENPDAIRAGTAAIASVIQRLPGAHLNRFVVSAARFFRDKRWQDDPDTWLRAGAGKNGHVRTGELDLGGRRPAETIKLSAQ